MQISYFPDNQVVSRGGKTEGAAFFVPEKAVAEATVGAGAEGRSQLD